MIIRERPPLRLSANISVAGSDWPLAGAYRWGQDNRQPEYVPNDLTFSTTMPGGFEHASCSLPRKPDVAYSDLVPFSTINIYGAGSQIAWQGRLEAAPRTSGDHYAITPGAVGWQAHLDDDPTARMVYVDTDMSHWQGPSTGRQLYRSNSGISLTGASVAPGTSSIPPSLVCELTGGPWSRFSVSEGWYDAKGLEIDGLYVAWQLQTPSVIGDYDETIVGSWGSWSWLAAVCADDIGNGSASTGNLVAAGPGFAWAPVASGKRWAEVELAYTVAGGGAGVTYPLYWTCLAVYGKHGLQLTGDADYTHAPGFTSSDIVAHAVRTWAPKLTATYGPDGTIHGPPLIITHLAFLEPTTASEIIKQATRFSLEDWWVDEGTTGQPTFSWMPRDDHGRRWRARVGPSGLSETGLDASKLYNSVVVVFRDVDGSTISVGPTGSGATTIDDTLADTDPENPATKAGLKRPGLLNLGIVSTVAKATKAGRAFLFNQKLLNTSGQAVLTGHVEDDHGILWPAWMVRAGDQISFVDAHSTVNRRIVRSSYNDAQKTCSIDLDSPPDSMDALLQRLGASIESLGL